MANEMIEETHTETGKRKDAMGVLRLLRDAFIEVIEDQGIVHEDACPEDDTCTCPMVGRVNTAILEADAILAEQSQQVD